MRVIGSHVTGSQPMYVNVEMLCKWVMREKRTFFVFLLTLITFEIVGVTLLIFWEHDRMFAAKIVVFGHGQGDNVDSHRSPLQ